MKVMNRSEKYIKLSIYLIVVVLVNIVGITLFFRVDLTADKIYSISEASKAVVATLSEPLTIRVFFTPNLPAPHNNTELYLRDLLEEYSIHANKYFNYTFYDVSPEGEALSEKSMANQKLAREYGINPVQIRLIEKDEIKFKNAYMGMVLIHGDVIEKIPTIVTTEGLEYRLTTAIQKMNNKISALLALPDKIKIDLYMSSSLSAVAPYMGLKELPSLPRVVETTVENLNRKNYGKLAFRYLDPTADPQLEADVKKYNLINLKWPALSGGKIPPGTGAIGMVVSYGEKQVEVPLLTVLQLPLIGTRYELTDMEELDTLVNETVETLVEINENIGYLADYDTLSLSAGPAMNPMMPPPDSLNAFNSLLSQNYSIKEVSLKDGGIPDSLKTLIIARPTEPLSDYDLYQIDQFLMGGKSLAIFLDTFKEVMPQGRQAFAFNQGPSYVPLDTGLEKLLAHYGVTVKPSYVMDESCYKQMVPQRMGGGERPIYFAPLIKQQNIATDLPFLQNIKGLVAMRISPLTVDEEKVKAAGITAHRLLASSDQSWEMKDRINLNPMFIRPPRNNEEKSSLPLAWLLEGSFTSYFAGKPIPAKPEDSDPAAEDLDIAEIDPQKTAAADKPPAEISKIEQSGAFRGNSKPSKIFVIASAEMIKDTMLDEEGQTPNATFLMNVIDTLNGRDNIAVMRSKVQRFNPLYDTDALTKTVVKAFNIAGMPVLVVLFGLLVWWKRHAKRKQIQMLFQR